MWGIYHLVRGRGPRGGSGGCVLSPNIAVIYKSMDGVEGDRVC